VELFILCHLQSLHLTPLISSKLLTLSARVTMLVDMLRHSSTLAHHILIELALHLPCLLGRLLLRALHVCNGMRETTRQVPLSSCT
jgi:hypothetical protein